MQANYKTILEHLIFALNHSGLDPVFIMDSLGNYLGDEVEKERITSEESAVIKLGMTDLLRDLMVDPS